MAVVLHHDMRILGLYLFHQATQRGWTAHAGHVLQRYLVGAELHQLVHDAHVVLHGMDGRVGNREGGLGNHAGLLGILDAELKVAGVVQSAERAHDVNALRFLHFAHQLAHILRHTVHAEAVQGALQHVGLDTGLVEGLGPGADGLVGVLAVHEVHLLEGAAVGLDAVEAAHGHDDRGDTDQLVDTGLVLATTLPHVAVDQAEFYLFLHIFFL